MDSKAVIKVPVAGIWTSPDSLRPIDKYATSYPLKLDAWLNRLTYKSRLELCEQNILQTQALFGEEVDVIREENGWSEVILPGQLSQKDGRGYPGWIPSVQLSQVREWNLEAMVAVVTNNKTVLYLENEKKHMTLSYQTVLPIIEEKQDKIVVQLPEGTGVLQANEVDVLPALSSRQKGNGRNILKCGEKFINLPYLWGGNSSFGYDCSGFTFSVCKANGYLIPRDADDQSMTGLQVKLNKIEPGDLLFFAYEEGKGKLHHVGLYYGNGKLLHSPKTGSGIEIIDLAGTVYETELCTACRYWSGTEE